MSDHPAHVRLEELSVVAAVENRVGYRGGENRVVGEHRHVLG